MITSSTKRYKKFFYQTLIFSGIGWLILQFSVYFLCRPAEWYWIYNTIKVKESIAHNIPGNKIVFAGGSATLFGVRTEEIQKELHIPTVNYGIHAALEIDYILNRVKKILKPGDVVIVPLEYNILLYDGDINEVRARFILLFDKNFYNSLPFFEKINYFLKFSPLTIELSIRDSFWKLIGRKSSLRSYDVNTLNQNGDETRNIGNEIILRKYNDLNPLYIQKNELKETFGLKTLNNFNTWCKKNNIKFYVTYACTISFDVYNNNEYQEYFKKIENYFAQHDIKTIGYPNDFFYDKDFFYDTEYHLNSVGMACHTRKLLSKIKDLFSYEIKN
jgi:hypothetical protein